MKQIALASIFVLGLAGLPTNAAAPESAFLDRFDGRWSGSGVVMKDDATYDVTCTMTGDPNGNQVAITGTCSVAIASIQISADITYDPATGRYAGTYRGAGMSPARISGKRSGNVVQLTVTWPQPVNGQMKARLVIENPGSGQLRIRMNETVRGSDMTTHDLRLRQV